MRKVKCIYCNREVEVPPDVDWVECSVCAMKRARAKVEMAYPPDGVQEYLDDVGWSWKDLAMASGESYQKLLRFKRGEVPCPMGLQQWLGENV